MWPGGILLSHLLESLACPILIWTEPQYGQGLKFGLCDFIRVASLVRIADNCRGSVSLLCCIGPGHPCYPLPIFRSSLRVRVILLQATSLLDPHHRSNEDHQKDAPRENETHAHLLDK